MIIGIAGSGRVAQALGRALHASLVASRSLDHARAAAQFIGTAQAVTLDELVCDRLIIAVSDRAIEEVAARVPAPQVALHTCGAHGAEILHALRTKGTHCGAMHPLQTFATAESGFGAFAIDGDPEAIRWAEAIAHSLDGIILRITPNNRALYHAAAVLASNDVVATVDAAIQIFRHIGITDSDARRALAPIARAALENVLANGAEAALTGPVERGDFATVRRHEQALTALPPAVQNLYRAAGAQAQEIVARRAHA